MGRKVSGRGKVSGSPWPRNFVNGSCKESKENLKTMLTQFRYVENWQKAIAADPFSTARFLCSCPPNDKKVSSFFKIFQYFLQWPILNGITNNCWSIALLYFIKTSLWVDITRDCNEINFNNETIPQNNIYFALPLSTVYTVMFDGLMIAVVDRSHSRHFTIK